MSGREWRAALAALLILGLAPPAAAGVISGRLVNKTPGRQSVAGVQVLLSREEGDGDQQRSTRTDSQGRFRFDGVPAGAGLRYRLVVRYQGAEYTQGALSAADARDSDLAIPVWDATNDPARIRVTRHHLLVEANPDGLRVQEVMVVENTGDRTFVGTRAVSGDRRATLEFALPREWMDVRYEDGLMECCMVPTEEGLADTMDVKPGTREVRFNYQLKLAGKRYRLLKKLDYPTDEVDVFVAPASLLVSSETLATQGKIAAQGRGYLRLKRARVERGTLLAVDLAGLAGSAFPWTWLAYASVPVFIGGGVAYLFIRRSRQHAAFGASGPAPQVPAPPTPSRLELELRRTELLAGLAILDEKFEAGLIAEAEYRMLHEDRNTQLADVMRALEE